MFGFGGGNRDDGDNVEKGVIQRLSCRQPQLCVQLQHLKKELKGIFVFVAGDEAVERSSCDGYGGRRYHKGKNKRRPDGPVRWACVRDIPGIENGTGCFVPTASVWYRRIRKLLCINGIDIVQSHLKANLVQ